MEQLITSKYRKSALGAAGQDRRISPTPFPTMISAIYLDGENEDKGDVRSEATDKFIDLENTDLSGRANNEGHSFHCI
jgi:hypothetical protein